MKFGVEEAKRLFRLHGFDLPDTALDEVLEKCKDALSKPDTYPSNLDEPVPVYVKFKDGDERRALGWACHKCGAFFPSRQYAANGTEALHQAFLEAQLHCAPKQCTRCEAEIETKYNRVCESCLSKDRAEESAKLDRKLRENSVPWDHTVECLYYYDEYYFDDDHFFDVVADNTDFDPDNPPIVQPCSPQNLRLDAEELVHGTIDNGDWHEGASEQISKQGMEKLQKYLDLWCAKYPVTSWFARNQSLEWTSYAIHEVMDRQNEDSWFAKAREGKFGPHELEDTFKDAISAWHDGAGEGAQLHTYLGMTWKEYASWVEQKKTLKQLVKESLHT